MPSTREMRLRIKSVKNISQVTRALETVSASKVRRAMQAVNASQSYAEKAWKVLIHLARQPGHSPHPLLSERSSVRNVLVLMISGDRGLAGAYTVNILRQTLGHFRSFSQPISYVAVGRKGRDMLLRRRKNVIAEFHNLPSPVGYGDVSAIGRLVVEEYRKSSCDQVYLAYTNFINLVTQKPIVRKLLPLEVTYGKSDKNEMNTTHPSSSVFVYEPDETGLLDQIVPRFIGVQIFQAILTSQASEHAARMVAMRNATDNANELLGDLQLQYNKYRQQIITNEMLDIAGGAEALK